MSVMTGRQGACQSPLLTHHWKLGTFCGCSRASIGWCSADLLLRSRSTFLRPVETEMPTRPG